MQTRAVLQSYFLTGEYPTQAQFAELIASFVNILDDVPPKYYTYTYTAQDSVVLVHDLGRIPMLQFIDTDTGQQFDPVEVLHDMVSMNFVTITFGYARNTTVTLIG